MKDKMIIGVDCSTQSTKALLVDARGSLIHESRAAYAYQSPHNGWAEQDASELWKALCNSLSALSEGLDPGCTVAGLAIAYQRETFVLLDKSGKEIRPAILWLDQRSFEEVREIDDRLGADFFQQTTGKPLHTLPSLPKLCWVRNHEPENFQRIDKVCDVGAYLNWKLTGNMVSPFPGADTTGLFDIRARDWSDDLLQHVNLTRENMAGAVSAGESVGRLTAEASKRTGLPEGLPVFAAGGDGQVFSVGVGALDKDTIALSLGTSVVLGMHVPMCRPNNYYRVMMSCHPDWYYNESVLISGSRTIRWFVENMTCGEQEEARIKNISPEALLEEGIRDIPPGSEGLVTVPYWRGVMTPYNNPEARGMTLGWSDYHTRHHFYRSILEGIALDVRLVIDGYRASLDTQPRSIMIGSGGAESTVWAQIIADVNGIDVLISESVENTALGAAMIAAWGAGLYGRLSDASEGMSRSRIRLTGDRRAAAVYDRLYNEVYRKIYVSVSDSLSILSSFR
jgi:xylulokinase